MSFRRLLFTIVGGLVIALLSFIFFVVTAIALTSYVAAASRLESCVVFPNATINGQPARLILDTGAEMTSLSELGARHLGVKIALPAAKSNISTPDNSRLALSESVKIAAAGETFTAQLLLLNMLDDPIDGLIGWPEVRDNILVFDAAKHTVSSVPNLPPETADWIKLKVHSGTMLILEIPLPDGTKGNLEVDTGSDSGAVLPQSQWQAWKAAHPGAAISSKAFYMPGTIAGRHQISDEESWADEVQLGSLTITHVPVSGASTAEADVTEKYAGTLGLDALARLDLVVDGKNGFAYLRPKAESADEKNAPPNTEALSGGWKIAGPMPLKIDGVFAVSGGAKIKHGNIDDAIADLNHALEINPKNAEAYTYRGTAKEDQGDFSGAAADYSHVLEFDPKNADAYASRGDVKDAQGDYDGALADYARALELDPKNADFYTDRGETKGRHGDDSGAMADYARALELDPKDAYIYESRAITRQNQGDFAGALPDYDKSIELKPDDSFYPYLYRELLQLRLKKAPAGFKNTVAGWEDSWSKSLGQFLLGNLDESKLLQAAEKKDEEPVAGQKCEAYYFIGMMRLLKGDQTGARDFFKKSMSSEFKDYYEYHFASVELARLDALGK